MICSTLIPSRFRPDGLIKAIESLIRQSSNQNQIEFIIRLDNDDEESISRQSEFRSFPNVTIIVGLRIPVPDMMAEMASLAKGKWILVFNDDAWMEGLNWDNHLLAHPTSGVILQPEFHNINGCSYPRDDRSGFPFFPNGCWKEFGHTDFLPAPCDSAASTLAKQHRWKIEFMTGVTIHHDRKADRTLPYI